MRKYKKRIEKYQANKRLREKEFTKWLFIRKEAKYVD